MTTSDAGGDLGDLLGRLRPELRPGTYVFVTTTGPTDPALHPVMTFAEDEGQTLVLPQHEADGAALAYGPVLVWLTLTVHSALDGVGLTAAVSGALAAAGISCNVVAAAFHDHLFVPVGSADAAVRVLTELSARHRPARPGSSSAGPAARPLPAPR